jgi:hypothetical protein
LQSFAEFAEVAEFAEFVPRTASVTRCNEAPTAYVGWLEGLEERKGKERSSVAD